MLFPWYGVLFFSFIIELRERENCQIILLIGVLSFHFIGILKLPFGFSVLNLLQYCNSGVEHGKNPNHTITIDYTTPTGPAVGISVDQQRSLADKVGSA